MLVNACAHGSDGRTPWQRVKGQSFRQLLLCFGESVLYKLPTNGPNNVADGNRRSRWLAGVFLGYSRSANAYIVAAAEGVANVRSIYQRPAGNRWSFETISRISAAPLSLRDKPEVEAEFLDNGAEPQEVKKRAD